jgi:hypothetical protein
VKDGKLIIKPRARDDGEHTKKGDESKASSKPDEAPSDSKEEKGEDSSS